MPLDVKIFRDLLLVIRKLVDNLLVTFQDLLTASAVSRGGEFELYRRRWILLSIVFFLNYTNATV